MHWMEQKKTGLPERKKPTDTEQMADAMAYSTLAKQERAQQEQETAYKETQPKTARAAAPQEEPPSRAVDSKKKRKHRRKKGGFEEKDDPYYGLKLKSREEYQKEYEQTLSFKPVRPQVNAKVGEPTETFSFLFDENDVPDAEDQALQKRFEKMHEERRRRVKEVAKETGASNASDLAKTDVFNITTAISLDEIRKVAEKRGVDTKSLPRVGHPQTPPAPVREPSPPQRSTRVLPDPPAVQEPHTRPPQPKAQGRQIPATYRPTGTPIHVVALDDLLLPIFNEAKTYPHDGAPAKPARPLQPPRAVVDKPSPAAVAAAREAAAEEAAKVQEKPAAPAPSAPAADAAKTAKPFSNITPLPVPHAAKPEPAELPAAKDSPFARHTLEGKAQVRDVQEEPEQSVRRRRPAPPQASASSPLPEEEAEPFRPDEKEAELEDYTSPDDAPSVFSDLGGKLRELMLRASVAAIAMVLQFVFGFLGEYGIFGLPPMNMTAYLICSLIFLAVAMAFCGTTILNGLKALFRLRANADSAVAVASVVGIIQEIAALFNQAPYQSGTTHLYASVLTAALFLNTCGKFLMIRRIYKNFQFVASPEKKYAAEKYTDHNIALQLAEGCTLDTPSIAYQRPTKFYKHFLRLSYSDDPSDRSSQFLAPVLFCAGLVLFLVVLLLRRDVTSALSAFAAATCVSTPLMNMLSVNLPLGRLSRVATQCGGMVVGFPAVQYFSDTNAVMVDAADLFPKGTVVLNGIKTFGGRQIDDALVDAAALMQKAGGPLASMFSQILRSRNGLPKVEDVHYEDGMGLSGWVGGKRLFLGNRRLLIAHNITPPDESLEQRYRQGGKQFTYLAVGNQLMAMFIMTYQPDRHRATELQRMEQNGISLIVRSNDPNVTAPFLAAVFHLDAHTVRVLPERLGQVYTGLVKDAQKDANILIATRGRPTAFMRLVTACVRMRGNITIAVVMQTVCAILGFVLVAFLCCQPGGTTQVSTLGLLLYELFWSIAIWLVPRFQKP